MDSAKRAWIALVVTIITALSAASAGAQQSTPSAQLNPNWCSSAPPSPPPPQFEHKPGAMGSGQANLHECPQGRQGMRGHLSNR